MRNKIIDINKNKNSEVRSSNDDLGELLLPDASSNLTFPRLNDEIEILRNAPRLLDFIPLHASNSLWCVDIVYRSTDSQTKHAKLARSFESEYVLQVAGHTFSYKSIENALNDLLNGGLFDKNGNVNQAKLPRN